jgi:hypothetical protein
LFRAQVTRALKQGPSENTLHVSSAAGSWRRADSIGNMLDRIHAIARIMFFKRANLRGRQSVIAPGDLFLVVYTLLDVEKML